MAKKKKCTKCKKSFLSSNKYFHSNGLGIDGRKRLYSECKECKNKSRKKRLSDPAVQEWVRKYDIEWKKKQRDENTQYAKNQREICRKGYQRRKKDPVWVAAENKRKRTFARAKWRSDPEYRQREAIRRKEYKQNNPEIIKALDKKWDLLKKERRWVDEEYHERTLELSRKSYSRRKDDPAFRAKRNAKAKRRGHLFLNAKPSWLTEELQEQIEEIYLEAQLLSEQKGEPCEVDHVYPLYGTNAKGEHISSGLHVPWNLEAITRHQNRSKGHTNPEYIKK
jgi:hypothetical protein|tara:strand:+ start:760 stop:1599 length:840 start_codon:yes stop_codon:yes gene_type:complete